MKSMQKSSNLMNLKKKCQFLKKSSKMKMMKKMIEINNLKIFT